MMTAKMSSRTGTWMAAAAVALLLPALQGASTVASDSIVELTVESGTIAVSGTSNAHDWTCEATRFDAALQVGMDGAGGIPASVAGASVTVPVEALECGNGGMDKNLRKALAAEKFPTIAFTMTGHQVRPDASKPGVFQVVAEGTLSLAGAIRPITMTVDGVVEGDRLRIRGSRTLRMTDFGVKPPTAMLGVLKTGDEVTVKFDLTTRFGAPVR